MPARNKAGLNKWGLGKGPLSHAECSMETHSLLCQAGRPFFCWQMLKLCRCLAKVPWRCTLKHCAYTPSTATLLHVGSLHQRQLWVWPTPGSTGLELVDQMAQDSHSSKTSRNRWMGKEIFCLGEATLLVVAWLSVDAGGNQTNPKERSVTKEMTPVMTTARADTGTPGQGFKCLPYYDHGTSGGSLSPFVSEIILNSDFRRTRTAPATLYLKSLSVNTCALFLLASENGICWHLLLV